MKTNDTLLRKEYADLRHSQKRFFERYGRELSPHEYNLMCNAARTGEIQERQKFNRIVCSFIYKDNIYKVIFNTRRKKIITFLK